MGIVAIGALVVGAGSPPTEGISDDRLFALSAQLKCQQCVGESVADSQSPSAIQFREEISAQMARGNTDAEILNYFVERYGRDVLLTPPSTGIGSLVWIVPVVGLAGAVLLLVGSFRRWRTTSGTPEVTDEDVDRVRAAQQVRRGGTAGPTDGT
jgi:cytochrome c-type biogenesis protein CcmH